MKKLIAITTTCIIVAAMSLFAFADTAFPDSKLSAIDIWLELRNQNLLYVDDFGTLEVQSNTSMELCENYQEFLRLLDECNRLIQKGAIFVNEETLELQSVETSVPIELRNTRKNPLKKPTVAPCGGMHGCSETDLNLLLLCQNNYNTIVDYYNDMLNLTIINPDLDPWANTVVFWVEKVKEYGEWDYKRNPYYEPYNRVFCSYYDGEFHHITSEFLGNFNYGYTGSFLFDLTTLHMGSFAAAEFSTSDYDDWEAIDDGYYNAV